jgi:Domain of unknown function (DUF4832)/Domain of unknown function (DUF4874)
MTWLFKALTFLLRPGFNLVILCIGLGTTSATLASISDLQATNDSTGIRYQVSYTGTPSFIRIYLDTDQNGSSGFPTNGVGADYLIENGNLFRYAGTTGNWKWTFLKNVPYVKTSNIANWTLANTDIGSPAGIRLFAQLDPPLENSVTVTQNLTINSPPPPIPSGQQVVYTASNALIANPERGFYHQPGDCGSETFNLATLQGYRNNDSDTLIMCMFYLSNFVNAPISQATLNFFQNQLNTVRAAGLKVIVRFAYTESETGNDASPAQLAAHLDQLAPYFANNSDILYVVQAGFIGTWGEWYYTKNYGNKGVVSASDLAKRKAVVDKLLTVVPAQRMLQLRTPAFKQAMYGTTALADSEAFNGTAKARIGHHNDCFLASNNDQGTYANPTLEYPYLASDTKYLPMGGETCEYNLPRSDCATALDELSRFHWSFLNKDYEQTVLTRLSTAGCLPQIKQKLGYRFVMQNGIYTASAKPGGQFTVNITLQNQGWATPFNPRLVELVLRHTISGALYRFPVSSDPRLWLPGQTINISQAVTLPATMPLGNYTALLNLPDPAPGLSNRPEYAIQLANATVWEAATGFNNLLHTMTVAP